MRGCRADNVDSYANNKTALISEEIFCYVSNYLHCNPPTRPSLILNVTVYKLTDHKNDGLAESAAELNVVNT